MHTRRKPRSGSCNQSKSTRIYLKTGISTSGKSNLYYHSARSCRTFPSPRKFHYTPLPSRTGNFPRLPARRVNVSGSLLPVKVQPTSTCLHHSRFSSISRYTNGLIPPRSSWTNSPDHTSLPIIQIPTFPLNSSSYNSTNRASKYSCSRCSSPVTSPLPVSPFPPRSPR